MWTLGRTLMAWPRNYVGLEPAVIQQLAANINRGTWIQATALRIILRCGCLWKGTKKRSQRRLMWQVPGTFFLCDICNRVCSATRSRRRFNGAPTAVAVGTPLKRRLLSLLSVRAWAAGGATGQCRGILFEPDVSSGNVRLKAPPAMRCRLHIKQGCILVRLGNRESILLSLLWHAPFFQDLFCLDKLPLESPTPWTGVEMRKWKRFWLVELEEYHDGYYAIRCNAHQTSGSNHHIWLPYQN